MKQRTVTVSIIIPTYGGALELDRAIKSALLQTFKNIEVIVVDDNNPHTVARQNTEKIVAKYLPNNPIRYIQHKENKNGAAARNTGIAAAQGKYVCFLDDDDFYFPTRVEKSVACLEKNLEYDAVLCGVMDCTDSGLYGVRYHYQKSGVLKNELLSREIIMGSGSNIFLTRKSIDSLNGFDEGFRRLQDDEFMIRFYQQFQAIALDQLLIVKARNGINNEPALTPLYQSKMMFFKKYEKDIQQLSEVQLFAFYNYHYTALFNSAMLEKSSELKANVLSLLKSIRSITKKEQFKFFLNDKLLGRFMVRLYSVINHKGKALEYENHLQIKNSCTVVEQKFIDDYLAFKGSFS